VGVGARGAPALPVRDRPVGLAPPRLVGLPLALRSPSPPARADPPGPGGRARLSPRRTEPLRPPLLRLLGGGRRCVRRADDVRGRAPERVRPARGRARPPEPCALPRAAPLLLPPAPRGQAAPPPPVH